jgi:hypothetical protein
MRPIRCRKIRYFEDARFKARLFPPPERPPAVEMPTVTSAARSAAPASAAEADESVAPPTREGSVEDIDRLESLTLEDFDADFSQVTLPESGRLTEADLGVAVESFLASLRER